VLKIEGVQCRQRNVLAILNIRRKISAVSFLLNFMLSELERSPPPPATGLVLVAKQQQNMKNIYGDEGSKAVSTT
jgi:hypothetical protein